MKSYVKAVGKKDAEKFVDLKIVEIEDQMLRYFHKLYEWALETATITNKKKIVKI